MDSQLGKKMDNSCITVQYHEADAEGRRRTAYGKIKRMFKHSASMASDPAAPDRCLYLAECDWYEVLGQAPEDQDEFHWYNIEDMTTIRYNPNFDRCRLVDLETCIPRNCVFWPLNPLNGNPEGHFIVVYHHD